MNYSNPLPTLAEAKEYAKFIKEPKNGQIVVINSVAPMKLSNGADIDKETQKTLQKQLNRQGMLVVYSNGDIVKEGEIVALNEHPTFNLTRVVTSNKLHDKLDDEVKEGVRQRTGKYANYNDTVIGSFYRKYVVIVLHPIQICCTLNND